MLVLFKVVQVPACCVVDLDGPSDAFLRAGRFCRTNGSRPQSLRVLRVLRELSIDEVGASSLWSIRLDLMTGADVSALSVIIGGVALTKMLACSSPLGSLRQAL